jgi:hypothetical protein
MSFISAISQVEDLQVLPDAGSVGRPSDPSATTSFQAALRNNDATPETPSGGIFEIVGTAAKGLREDRQHVDAAFKTAVDTLDPWAMGKAAEAMSEYSHATQLATKLLNHATQSIEQLTRGS